MSRNGAAAPSRHDGNVSSDDGKPHRETARKGRKNEQMETRNKIHEDSEATAGRRGI